MLLVRLLKAVVADVPVFAPIAVVGTERSEQPTSCDMDHPGLYSHDCFHGVGFRLVFGLPCASLLHGRRDATCPALSLPPLSAALFRTSGHFCLSLARYTRDPMSRLHRMQVASGGHLTVFIVQTPTSQVFHSERPHGVVVSYLTESFFRSLLESRSRCVIPPKLERATNGRRRRGPWPRGLSFSITYARVVTVMANYATPRPQSRMGCSGDRVD